MSLSNPQKTRNLTEKKTKTPNLADLKKKKKKKKLSKKKLKKKKNTYQKQKKRFLLTSDMSNHRPLESSLARWWSPWSSPPGSTQVLAWFCAKIEKSPALEVEKGRKTGSFAWENR